MPEGRVLHIISEIGGCVIGLPTDREGIVGSLRRYALRHEMEGMEMMDPETDDLGDWTDIAEHAVTNFGVEGPVLVGIYEQDRILVGVSKRYGYPVRDDLLHDIIKVVRLPHDLGATDPKAALRETFARRRE